MRLLTVASVGILVMSTLAQPGSSVKSPVLPSGYWPIEKSQPIVDKTQTIRLSAELNHLSEGERRALPLLLEVGKIFQDLYEQQRHPDAVTAYAELKQLDQRQASQPVTQNLLTLYRLNQGPIAVTLENKREAFLPVDGVQPGKNVYPWAVKKDAIESFLSAEPEEREELLDLRSVVKRASAEEVNLDLSKLRQYPVLDTLHPGLRRELENMLSQRVKAPRTPKSKVKVSKATGDSSQTPGAIKSPEFYAVPYAVAYADELIKAYSLLNQASDVIEKDDSEFAGYLRNRARDLLSNDYESGDAAWVTGHFKNLNAQIGSYEVYDDELYGVKSFFGFSLLSIRRQETTALREAMRGLQTLEESLPYEHHKKVRENIPVGVYDVIADFGQTRGGNTATILPNESYLARRYGRTILLRANIMREPNIFEGTSATWDAAIAAAHKNDLTADGNFYRTLWHEVGHYLGVDRTKDNRDLDETFRENASALEEMKADLVSLFVASALRKRDYYTEQQLRSVYASGILRVLLNNKPRRDQPYNTMQLIQWNYFLQNGLLHFNPATNKLSIHYDKYHEVIGKLLAKVLEVQYSGDKGAADRFIEEYTKWDDSLHGVVAKSIREQQRDRFRLFKYESLNE